MNLEDLLRRFRTLADDKLQPFFWQDEDIIDWLNDAQEQAAVRGRLLREDSDPRICSIALDPAQRTYRLHEAVVEIINVQLLPGTGDRPLPLHLVSREWLDAEIPDWRQEPNRPRYAIQDDVSLRLVGVPSVGDSLALECYRLPLKSLANETDKPEIHRAHHEHLLDWVLNRAYSVPDTEKFDARRQIDAELAFTKYFGPLPDSDMRRTTRTDVVHYNKSPLM